MGELCILQKETFAACQNKTVQSVGSLYDDGSQSDRPGPVDTSQQFVNASGAPALVQIPGVRGGYMGPESQVPL